MFTHPDNLIPIHPSMIRQSHPEISFPPDITAEHVEDLGYLAVEYDDQPEIGPGETLEPGEIRIEDGRAVQGWVVISADPAGWAEAVADRRYGAETGGTTVNGLPLDTGRDSQALITGAALAAMLDSDYTVRWKTQSGFVELDAEQIIAVASAVRAHVQACFDREAELLAELDADTFTPEMLEEGWPDGQVSATAES